MVNVNKKNPHFFSWINPSLEVRSTLNKGKGVFAKKLLAKDDILAIFGGYVMTLDDEESLPKEIRDYAHQIEKGFVLGVRKKDEIQPVDYFNHSCNPNAGFNGQIFLVAMQEIVPEEEVTFDYAMVLYDDTVPYNLECFCGLPCCRKIITESDWKNPILQEKYSGYFQYYLEKIIRNQKK